MLDLDTITEYILEGVLIAVRNTEFFGFVYPLHDHVLPKLSCKWTEVGYGCTSDENIADE